jgi:hypothetical protein
MIIDQLTRQAVKLTEKRWAVPCGGLCDPRCKFHLVRIRGRRMFCDCQARRRTIVPCQHQLAVARKIGWGECTMCRRVVPRTTRVQIFDDRLWPGTGEYCPECLKAETVFFERYGISYVLED